MGYFRLQKVTEEIKRVIGEIILKDMSEEHFGFVTVTKVKCSPDLRNATVYISILAKDAEEKQKGYKKVLYHASKIRGLLGQRIRIKYIPFLKFKLDDSLDYAEKIEGIIQEIHKEDTEKTNE